MGTFALPYNLAKIYHGGMNRSTVDVYSAKLMELIIGQTIEMGFYVFCRMLNYIVRGNILL